MKTLYNVKIFGFSIGITASWKEVEEWLSLAVTSRRFIEVITVKIPV